MRSGFRILVWAAAGVLVSAGWGLYFTNANKGIPIGMILYALASLTQPAAAVVVYLNPHYPLGLNVVAIANGISYAFVGFIVDTIRRHFQMGHVSN